MFTLNRTAFALPRKSHRTGGQYFMYDPMKCLTERVSVHTSAISVTELIKLRGAEISSGASHIGEILCHN